jgi:hypothetical protein
MLSRFTTAAGTAEGSGRDGLGLEVLICSTDSWDWESQIGQELHFSTADSFAASRNGDELRSNFICGKELRRFTVAESNSYQQERSLDHDLVTWLIFLTLFH